MSQSTPTETFLGYRVRREHWRIGQAEFDLTWPANMDALLDSPRTRRRHQADGYMPYWAQPWPSSSILAEYVLTGADGAGRSALELGCGIGIVGLAAAKMRWSVTLSDYDEDGLAFACLNAERNHLPLAGSVQLDYCRNPPTQQYDLILGSDLLYERRYGPVLAQWIANALAPGGTALLSDPYRSAADEFTTYAQQHDLRSELLPREMTSPSGLLQRARIWRLTPG